MFRSVTSLRPLVSPNVKPEVKQAADVTLAWSNAEDGVARQCEKLRAEGRLRPLRSQARREKGLT